MFKAGEIILSLKTKTIFLLLEEMIPMNEADCVGGQRYRFIQTIQLNKSAGISRLQPILNGYWYRRLLVSYPNAYKQENE